MLLLLVVPIVIAFRLVQWRFVFHGRIIIIHVTRFKRNKPLITRKKKNVMAILKTWYDEPSRDGKRLR